MRRIQSTLSDEAFMAIRGNSDSEHLFALFLDAHLSGASIPEALNLAIVRAGEHLGGAPALTTLVASDGEQIYARRAGLNGGKPPTLFYSSVDGAHTFASEPLDESAWVAFPEDGDATMDKDGVSGSW